MNIAQLVTFAILMQSGEGILGVAPSYIMEKYGVVQRYDRPELLLDSTNRKIFDDWVNMWSANRGVD